ncbi:hypothetical protein BC938DRAFT_482120 [Jimgerdemannia flammicorona]|uniref:Uncharacterized protein n=1 Tax=Jimgerdemannia flammicorona TaxID=994334 RepID=A0A433QEH8_9FUNG|nr:hypothetical protein BC938DRAFT_482120 [Jimgerdemannia flammicorona]
MVSKYYGVYLMPQFFPFARDPVVYYLVGISTVVNRRLALKKEGRLQEELQRFGKESDIHAHTATTPTPLPNVGQPGRTGDD